MAFKKRQCFCGFGYVDGQSRFLFAACLCNRMFMQARCKDATRCIFALLEFVLVC